MATACVYFSVVTHPYGCVRSVYLRKDVTLSLFDKLHFGHPESFDVLVFVELHRLFVLFNSPHGFV